MTARNPKRKLNVPPETRKAFGERMQRQWEDPEFRAKHAAAVRAYHNKAKNDPIYILQRKNWGHDMKYHAGRLMAYRAKLDEQRKSGAFASFSDKAKRQWQDPDYVAKVIKAVRGIPIEARRRAQKAAIDKVRGFSIPKRLQAEYRFLTVTKRLRAAEAGRILGLV